MKLHFFCMSLLLSLSVFSEYVETTVSVNNVFVPKGFDSNDDAEVVLKGYFPSTCYLRAKAQANINKDGIHVSVKAKKLTDRNCIMVEVPFTLPVKLGNLNTGVHNIIVNDNFYSSITIEKAGTSKIDNYNYANVVSVEKENGQIVMKGYHPSSCMVFDQVIVQTNDNNDTVSVMPVIKQQENKPICDRRAIPFSYALDLPNNSLSIKDILVHVRTIDGNALNAVFNQE